MAFQFFGRKVFGFWNVRFARALNCFAACFSGKQVRVWAPFFCNGTIDALHGSCDALGHPALPWCTVPHRTVLFGFGFVLFDASLLYRQELL